MNYTRIHKYTAIIFTLILFAGKTVAQTVSAKADRDKILIGEQINLLLKADNLDGGIAQWFNLPDTINHLEVVKRSKIDTIQIAGNNIYQQNIIITSFDSGHWQIPALSLLTTNKVSLSTQPIEIDVLPVDVSQLQDYHDIKEILEVEQQSSATIIAIIALITLLSLAALYWLLRKKKPAPVAAPIISDNLSPVDWARQELLKLQQEELVAQNKLKQHYQRLTDITRQYFYLQLHHRSLHQTTDEWMVTLQSLPIGNDVRTSFLQLLRLADTVKFAKYLPPAYENEQSVPIASQMVEQVAQWQNSLNSSPHKKS